MLTPYLARGELPPWLVAVFFGFVALLTVGPLVYSIVRDVQRNRSERPSTSGTLRPASTVHQGGQPDDAGTDHEPVQSAGTG